MYVHKLKLNHGQLTNYCYIIVDNTNGKAVIVDPAWQSDKISRKLTELNVTPVAILLTHSHYDHVNLADAFAKKYSSIVLMSKDEIDCYGYRCTNLYPIENGSEFRLNNILIEPLATSGHTKGSVCYLIDQNLFSGDTLFIEGCGTCWGKGASVHAMFDSFQFLKKNISSSTRIFPGHSFGKEPGLMFEELKHYNAYLHFDRRDCFVSFRMRKNQPGMFTFI